jgi:hypothetical protein
MFAAVGLAGTPPSSAYRVCWVLAVNVAWFGVVTAQAMRVMPSSGLNSIKECVERVWRGMWHCFGGHISTVPCQRLTCAVSALSVNLNGHVEVAV